MSTSLVRDGFLMVGIVVAGSFAVINRAKIYEFVGIHPSDIVNQQASNVELATPEPEISETTMVSGSAASIRKGKDGQYWTEARVNSTSIRFLVDTGASIVALTPNDAQKAGLRLKQLTYNAPVNTAAGQIMAAPIELDIISVGNVTVRNVRGVVIPDGLTHSLLGMSYLGELQKVEVTQTALILRQ